MQIRALRPEDDRATFRSGDPDLDRFFLKFAGQNQFRHHIGTTYVVVDNGFILAFVTVAPGKVEIERLPISVRRKLPRYPLPVLRLARLAVDQSVHGQGLGTRLLRFVLDLALDMSDDYGCVGVLVDAKPDAADFYSRYGFIPLEGLEGVSESRPRPVPMFLSMRAISRARSKARRT